MPFEPETPPADFVEKRLIPALLPAAPLDALFRAAFGEKVERSIDPLWAALNAATAKGLAELGACLRDPAREAPPARLLGLGHGLTPSGDDILTGAMLALHAVGGERLAGLLASALARRCSIPGQTASARPICARPGWDKERRCFMIVCGVFLAGRRQSAN